MTHARTILLAITITLLCMLLMAEGPQGEPLPWLGVW